MCNAWLTLPKGFHKEMRLVRFEKFWVRGATNIHVTTVADLHSKLLDAHCPVKFFSIFVQYSGKFGGIIG